jgi:molybdenum cofactor cytidylyltransferase
MISAILLAAGMSTRMGNFKQLMMIRGRPLIVSTLETILSCPFHEVIVVLGHRADEVRQVLNDYLGDRGFRIVVNRDYTMGMSTSLKLGVSSISQRSEAFMVFLADQPFVKRETILRIMREYALRKPPMIVPTYRGVRGNPVLIDRGLVGEIMELTGDVGARAIMDRHSVLLLETEDPGVIMDIDTEEDLRRFTQVR